MKRFILGLFILAGIASAQPYTDPFAGGNETPVSTNWASFVGNFDKVSNRLQHTGTAAEVHVIRYTPNALPDDQCAQVVLTNVSGTNSGGGVGLRLASGTVDGYQFELRGSGGLMNIGEWNSGTESLIVYDVTPTLNEGDVARGEAVGTGLSLHQNATQVLSTTDATHTTGYGGIGGYYGSQVYPYQDDWKGAAAGGCASTPSRNRFVMVAQTPPPRWLDLRNLFSFVAFFRLL